MAAGLTLAGMGTLGQQFLAGTPEMLGSSLSGISGGGFLSGLGGWLTSGGLPTAVMGAGMGLSTLQAFGGASSGYAPMFKVPLSPEGTKLKTSLYKKTKEQWETGLLPENLASIYMGRVKREEEKTHKQARGFLTSMAGGRTRGGTEIKALLTESKRRMQGLTGPAQWKAAQREEELRNAMKMMENIRNIEMQTPMLQAQASMYKDIMGKGRRAMQGQALGDIAQFAALSQYFK